jgi:hypothetical protein
MFYLLSQIGLFCKEYYVIFVGNYIRICGMDNHMKSKLLSILLVGIFAGCSPKMGTKWNEVVATGEINFISAGPDCDSSFTEAVNYWYSHGYRLKVNSSAEKTLICLPKKPMWTNLIWPFGIGGVSNGKVAWAEPSYVSHEMKHLVWDDMEHKTLFGEQGTFRINLF